MKRFRLTTLLFILLWIVLVIAIVSRSPILLLVYICFGPWIGVFYGRSLKQRVRETIVSER